ncbi:MAG TPA: tripartite tricarboxylate transporter TctB family protein [Thermodesulfobacteriota bacterium]|nr:tripartite tricarboxylate transporter TctB family protein [Thermodesulfobacteriota bacterium]
MNASGSPNPDRSSALVGLVFAIVIGAEACRLGLGKLGKPGPGLTPFFYACVLALLAGALFLRSWNLSEPGARVVLRWRSILPILAILLTYGLTIEWLGYLIDTFFVVVLLLRIGGARWAGSLLFAAASTAGVNLIFVRWLAVPLPIGSIFP